MTSIEKELAQAYVALHNAANDLQVLATLTLYGYNSQRLQEGLVLYEVAHNSVETQTMAHFSKATGSKSFQQSWREAQLQYSQDRRAARVAFQQNEEIRSFLQLDGSYPKSFDSWHQQARTFYVGLLNQPELQAVVQTLGLTVERIQQGIHFLHQLKTARLQQHAQKGSVGDTRNQRNEAFEALHRWMVTFRQVARAAFASDSVHLATLGLQPESRRQKKKDEVMLGAKPAVDTTTSLTVAQ